MRSDNIQEKIRYWIFSDRIPATKLILCANILTFLIGVFISKQLWAFLAFNTSTAVVMPWTGLTYVLQSTDQPINFLFSLYWLWVAGGSVERAWGSARYAAFFFAITVISALGVYVGSLIAHSAEGLVGLWMPLAGVTIAFALLNPESVILFMFIIPLKLKYLAVIDAVLVFASYAGRNPWLGLCALAGCAAAFFYVRHGDTLDFRSRHYDDGKIIRIRPRHRRMPDLNPVKWLKSRRDRKRLDDLFRRSGFDD